MSVSVCADEASATKTETSVFGAIWFQETISTRSAFTISRALFPSEEDRTTDSHPVAVITYACWQKRFASAQNISGQSLRINNRLFTVIGRHA
jgi:hypothetical protein